MSWPGDWKLQPETAAEIEEAETVQGKRKRLQEMSRHDPLVRAVMNAAYYHGLSGEDTMTMLAYVALLDRDRFKELVLHQAMITPARMIFEPPATEEQS